MTEQDHKPTIHERLDTIENVLCNEIWHELRWHRRLLLMLITAVIGGAIAIIVAV